MGGPSQRKPQLRKPPRDVGKGEVGDHSLRATADIPLNPGKENGDGGADVVVGKHHTLWIPSSPGSVDDGGTLGGSYLDSEKHGGRLTKVKVSDPGPYAFLLKISASFFGMFYPPLRLVSHRIPLTFPILSFNSASFLRVLAHFIIVSHFITLNGAFSSVTWVTLCSLKNHKVVKIWPKITIFKIGKKNLEK